MDATDALDTRIATDSAVAHRHAFQPMPGRSRDRFQPDHPANALLGQPVASAGDFEVILASTPEEEREAFRLRHRVFVGELGAQIDEAREGEESDLFDRYCRHLIARERSSGRVIGCYRVLMPEQGRQLGFLYSDREFDLSAINDLRPQIVEIGRACVDLEFRTGTVLMLLWRAVVKTVLAHGHRYLIGCCSVPAQDGGIEAARLYRQLAPRHLAPPERRVRPRTALAVDPAELDPSRPPEVVTEVPSLLASYLKNGAHILGAPHLDRAFGCADLPLLVDLHAMDARLRERLLRSAAAR